MTILTMRVSIIEGRHYPRNRLTQPSSVRPLVAIKAAEARNGVLFVDLTPSSFHRARVRLPPIAHACDCRQYPAWGDRGFVDFGANCQKRVAHGVGNRGRWGNGAAFAHTLHAVFGVRGRGVQM